MCGIIGIAGGGEHCPEEVLSGVRSLDRRGPDDSGTLAFPSCVLGHTRLSVIDIGGGRQPMADAERKVAIAFNGEIYNYRQLRRTLEAAGHRFATESDTEVVLRSYLEYGTECPKRLDGMFAFGIWDDRQQALFMARDRFGEKPLFYARAGEALIFASEIKAILATGHVKPKVDRVSLDNYLSLLYVPPWRTIYADIRPLKPACQALFRNGTLAETRYWQLTHRPLSISLDEATQTVQSMLADSVRSRLVADVEVGTLLSGGVDSSIVTMLAQKASSRPIKSFSAGFEDFVNELPYAAEVAGMVGTSHHEEQIRTDLVLAFEDVVRYFDEPFADSSNVPMQLVAQRARRSVKVVLSGDGGDELFLGYRQYRKHQHLPRIIRLARNLLSDPFEHFKNRIIRHFAPRERARLWKDGSAIETDPTDHIDLSAAETPIQKMNLVDIYLGLPGDMLTKVDRASMMHSLEVRCPFLNHRLAEFAYNLPVAYKSDGIRGKLILERAFRGSLPASVFDRAKQGFGAPVKDWLGKPEFKAHVERYLLSDPHIASCLDMRIVRRYVEEFYRGRLSLQFRIWVLLALEVWWRTHEDACVA
jgi:asparagine synthase (glutamine-hydrolysing)